MIAEEAVSLLRTAPPDVLASYYVGTLPFVLALLTFWAAMSQSAYAREQLPGAALALAILFLWMKTWQVRYARRLRALLSGSEPDRWTVTRALRTAAMQGICHSVGLFLLPAAFLALMPFPWVYAAFQNLLAVDDGSHAGLRELTEDATAQARRWPRQNLVVIWLLSPFLLLVVAVFFLTVMPVMTTAVPTWTMPIFVLYAVILAIAVLLFSPLSVIIAVNIATGAYLLVSLGHALTGTSSVFVESPDALNNSTALAIVVGLAWLCLDPVLKAAYVLRCYYGESLRSGEDLRAALRTLGRRALPIILAVIILGGSFNVLAQERVPGASVDPAALEKQLAATLQEAEYAWRMPRPPREYDVENPMFVALRSGMQWVGDSVKWVAKKIGEFIDRLIPARQQDDGASSDFNPERIRVAVTALTILLLLLLGILAYRLWRQQRQVHRPEASAIAGPAPDIESEETSAEALPQEGWLQMAEDLMRQGEWRLAMRALFLATLAGLAERKLIQIARSKANFEYKAELLRRGHSHPDLVPAFSALVRRYEAVWYGDHRADQRAAQDLFDRHGEVLRHA
ncbi:MAG: DUF4129 domain-containing protein [Candidatus Hydrogenedentes bacterium]|nr:DUF4129 domain-containing protein [Candidatus Hydrogenedentota bacterium]